MSIRNLILNINSVTVSYLIHYDSLLQNAIDIITKCDRMRQKFITKCIGFFITKCGSFITKCDSYYVATILLQSAIVITKYDVFYKLGQYTVLMLRHNNKSFITKNLRKTIMHRSKFKNRFNKCRTHENWCNYKTQRNFCVSLFRKTKQQYFKNLNSNDVTENKTFWQTIKPYFNEKGSGSDKTVLSENESVLTMKKKLQIL